MPALKSVMPDKLGMRSSNRPTIRPAPPDAKIADFDLTIGEAVDAWWNDGWWEGVVVATGKPNAEDFQIYIPGMILVFSYFHLSLASCLHLSLMAG